jgi:CheY-like chemotaxis protein
LAAGRDTITILAHILRGWIMGESQKTLNILYAEDDLDDQLLLQDALTTAGLNHRLRFVANGEELLSDLQNEDVRRPDLILLDLNMPKMDGRKALEEIKRNQLYKNIPVVILTTSSTQEDINICYKRGVNSFITKPPSFDELVQALKSLTIYWSEVVQLPEVS